MYTKELTKILKELEDYLIADGYKDENYYMKTLKEAQKLVIYSKNCFESNFDKQLIKRLKEIETEIEECKDIIKEQGISKQRKSNWRKVIAKLNDEKKGIRIMLYA